jgi:hypothetical protein
MRPLMYSIYSIQSLVNMTRTPTPTTAGLMRH